ncbi:Cation/H(+) antiporter 15 [Forsythia ovata]|uniref:Cation/H(+) antiporter 15 n=1 Tax=Forsythia ovata TaxID=205694 RepID=A0ABD1RJL8_9LAMI
MNDSDSTGLDSLYVCHYLNEINSRGVLFGDQPLRFSVPSFLLQWSLISLITYFVQFLLKPVGQPLIIAHILGGVILGPSVLGQNLTFLEEIFPRKSRLVLDTVSIFGFILFIFLIGVKIDPSVVLRSGKKALAVGVLGFFLPFGLAAFAAFLLNKFSALDNDISRALPQVVAMQSMTAFPVITCFLEDLKILNSDIGRLASSSSVICDVCLWSFVFVKFAVDLARTKSLKVIIGSLLSGVLFIIFVIYVIRPAALWVVRHTQEGRPVKEIYIFLTLVGVMGSGFIGEAIGIHATVASLVLGLVIPDGLPLGAALVETLDCFVTILMPLFFAVCGLKMDIFSIQNLKNVGVLQLVIFVAFMGKIMGTMLPLIYCRMPFRDALSLGLIMNTKGIVEIAFLNDFKNQDIMTGEIYTVMIISVVTITGVISPIVKILYDPSKRFVAYKRRTILHSRNNDELRILACVHCRENVHSITSFLQVSNPTKTSPIDLDILHLVKLMGRSSSLLVSHRQQGRSSTKLTESERIFNAFKKFEQQDPGLFMVHCYKAISPLLTMHNDVCSLALEKRTILIILPFHKQGTFEERVKSSFAYRHLNKSVLEKAPCSVGILIDNGSFKNSRHAITQSSSYQVAVLFFGGADDREALAYALRISEHSSVRLTLILFVTSGSGDIVEGTERSKMLNAEILSRFMLRTHGYEEKMVTNGSDVIMVARSTGDAYNLVMVGRRHGESPIMDQLAKWNECGELGAIGEILADSEYEGKASVLVVQQQIRTGIILGRSFLGHVEVYSEKLFPPGGRLILETFADVGFMFHMFILGVNIDITLVKRAGNNAVVIGATCFFLPLAIGLLAMLIVPHFVTLEESAENSLPLVATINAITSFPVITSLLRDLNILNSEIGRIATLASLVCDMCHYLVSVAVGSVSMTLTSEFSVFWSIIWAACFLIVIVFALRPAILHVAKSIPEGQQMKEIQFIFIVVIVLICGLLAESLGQPAALGTFILGMATPDGPPLGSSLVYKLEVLNTGLLVPAKFALSGLTMDLFSVQKGNSGAVFGALIFFGYVGKFTGTLIPALYYRIPLRDAVSLSLIMCCRGVIEAVLYITMREDGIIDSQAYALLLISMLIVTGLARPLIWHLYDPSARYLGHKKSSILCSDPYSELRMLVCIHNEDNVPTLINLLETSTPLRKRPIAVFVVNLMELKGRAAAVLELNIGKSKKLTTSRSWSDQIANAFNLFAQRNTGYVFVQYFTSIAPYASMHDDICTIALEQSTNIVIVPFHKQWTIDGRVGVNSPTIRMVHQNVMQKAPCSVGVLVDRGQVAGRHSILRGHSMFRITMLFLGGADDCEALAYTSRLVDNTQIELTFVWLRTWDHMKYDDETEQTLDTQLVNQFRANTIGNQRITYKEEMVNDAIGTTKVIRTIEDNCDLCIVGKYHDPQSQLLLGLTEWNECPELGLIGDMLATSDFRFSVLVVQQQPLDDDFMENHPFQTLSCSYSSSGNSSHHQDHTYSLKENIGHSKF